MAEPEQTLSGSPVDFDTAVAFALQPEMRRLLLLYVVGALLLPFGLSMFVDPGFVFGPVTILEQLLGLALSVAGAAFLFGGVVGAAFKLVTDANLLAMEQQS